MEYSRTQREVNRDENRFKVGRETPLDADFQFYAYRGRVMVVTGATWHIIDTLGM